MENFYLFFINEPNNLTRNFFRHLKMEGMPTVARDQTVPGFSEKHMTQKLLNFVVVNDPVIFPFSE
jgi:hypothetical protein